MKPRKYFDWALAAEIIRSQVQGTQEVFAGIKEDWYATADIIFKDGKPVLDSRAFLYSGWATPALKIGDKFIVCATYNKQPNNWTEKALKILRK